MIDNNLFFKDRFFNRYHRLSNKTGIDRYDVKTEPIANSTAFDALDFE